MSGLKIKHTIRLSPEISMQMADYARRKRKPQALVVEAALASFLSTDGLYRAMGEASRNNDRPQYCDACFTGDYPIVLTDREDGGMQPQLALLAGRA